MTEKELSALLADMTIEEKVEQLVQLHGGFYGDHMELTGPEQSFDIDEEMLRFYDIDMNYASEPGAFRLWIGGSSETTNTAWFELK